MRRQRQQGEKSTIWLQSLAEKIYLVPARVAIFQPTSSKDYSDFQIQIHTNGKVFPLKLLWKIKISNLCSIQQLNDTEN